ncbi:MAG: hypothetical protein HY706_14480 [Candidatus Hydrogenedentes bacterium]|nr:hypothetical protein [Candidatus Hydrogenedentota bacterium]
MNPQWSRQLFGVWAIALLLFSILATFAEAQDTRAGGESPFVQINSDLPAVQFQQVNWNLELVRLGDSNWGQVCVDPNVVSRVARYRDAYINVFLYTPGSESPHWVVENLPVPAPSCVPQPGQTAPYPDPRSAQNRRRPVCRYFNLQPDTERGTGHVPAVQATVLLSMQPLPLSEDLLPAVQRFQPARFLVETVIENAEGFGPDPMLGTLPPRAINPDLPLGMPPAPITAVVGPIQDLAFPLCVYQTDAPNIECAINQCVPMAQANTIQFLDDQYNGNLLVWNLPELPIPGIGKVSSAGDIIFWEPVPENSVIANVDFFTRRTGVFDAESGSGSDICQLFRGLFGYLVAAGPYTTAEFRHQGTNSATIGDGAACDTITINLGGNVSNREGLKPTWEWMFDQLVQGRGVAICFGRYDVDGNRTSGHCIRVWGACKIGSTKYIRTLDDGDQGANNVGTRNQVFQVEDTGSPGNPGVPDGLLNMDGMSWEIEFANSIEAKPTLLIP